MNSGPLSSRIVRGAPRTAVILVMVSTTCSPLMVGSNAVMALTLALHELGTNAIKYGALSAPGGTIDLFWKLIDGVPGRRLWMQGVEHCGPPVEPPARKGFGSRLVSSATGRALGGEVELVYDHSGVTWLLVAPLDRISI